MGGSLSLGKVFGIPLRLHYTWFIIFVVLTILLSLGYFPIAYPLWQRIVWGMITSLLFFASVVAHELAHSLVAVNKGIPVKSITLFIFGGVSQIGREAARPATELLIALVGPLCSLVLGGIFYGIGFLLQGADMLLVGTFIQWLAFINIVLALFNLIPGFPLDGGRVLRAILWHFTGSHKRATRIASLTGRGFGYLLIAGGIMIMFVTHDWFGGLWLAFIGWFLDNAASTSYRQELLHESLQRISAMEVMTADCPVVPHDLTLRQLIDGYVLPSGHSFFMVVDQGKLEGAITLHDIKAVPQQRWDITTVRESMTPAGKLKAVHPGQDALSILEQMDEGGINQIPVVMEGRVVGVIARDNLIRFLRARSELGM